MLGNIFPLRRNGPKERKEDLLWSIYGTSLSIPSFCLAVNYCFISGWAGSSTRIIGIPLDEPDVDGDAFWLEGSGPNYVPVAGVLLFVMNSRYPIPGSIFRSSLCDPIRSQSMGNTVSLCGSIEVHVSMVQESPTGWSASDAKPSGSLSPSPIYVQHPRV